MKDATLYRDTIPPVPNGTARPLWSVMIPTYNCAHFLGETLESVLLQAPGPEQMQIEVVDDGSTQDDPEAVVAEIGQGRVGFYRQPVNVGHTRNFNTCLKRARGQLVHLLHGDDGVRPGFYEVMQRPFAANPELGAAFCRDIRMDEESLWLSIVSRLQEESGLLDDWLETIARGQQLQTPGMVVRRAVYEHLGGFDHRIRSYGEDWEMWVRIAAHYPVWYEVEPLALYRLRRGSLTGGAQRSGQSGKDMRQVMEINRAHLPADRAGAITREARKNFALASLRRCHRVLDLNDTATVKVLWREALRTSRAPAVWPSVAFVGCRWLWRHFVSNPAPRWKEERQP